MVQKTIRAEQATGVVGEVALSGAIRAQGGMITSSNEGANNVIGRALTHVAGQDEVFTVGGTGAFAGILASPKQYVKNGLQATMQVPDNTIVEAVYFTTGLFVELANAANIGDQVEFSQTDGKLQANGTGSATSGYTLLPNSKVVRNNLTAPGLAIIELTE